ncbi:MAG TPA: hypothetical protein VF749_13915 [Candidatus Acidoferrum sp.]
MIAHMTFANYRSAGSTIKQHGAVAAIQRGIHPPHAPLYFFACSRYDNLLMALQLIDFLEQQLPAPEHFGCNH